ncbi:unnamed protein product, partial [Rotaria sp. Silwood1]
FIVAVVEFDEFDDDDELIRSHIAARHRLSRSTTGIGLNTR